jgi:hypothetical protein
MHFGENQLSRSLIGLSPLTTGHPPDFQLWWVRASTRSYPRFTLPMARSPRFGSWACYSNALFGLAFATAPPHRVNLATHRKLAGSFFKRHAVTATISRGDYCDAPTACRHTVSGTLSLRSRGTFHHSLTVLSAIGHQGIFRLTRWSWQIHTGFLGPRATRANCPNEPPRFQLRGSYPLRRAFRIPFAYRNGFSLADQPADQSRQRPQPHTRNPCRVTYTCAV